MPAFKPKNLNHLTLRVKDIAAAQAFYTDVLGMTVNRRLGSTMTFLQCGDSEFVIVKSENPGKSDGKGAGIDHFGFKVNSTAEVDEAAEYLRDQHVTILAGPADRSDGRFVFFVDPDGNMLEIYCTKS